MLKNTLLFTDALRATGPKAFSVMIKPAGSNCNLKCTYCYYLEKHKLYSSKAVPRMNTELLEKFTKEYIESQDVPEVIFVWQGGEPALMGIDFYRKVIEFQKKYADGKVIQNSFQTNGTLLTDQWCEFLAENKMLVGISIDGPEHCHNKHRMTVSNGTTFETVMKGIRLLQKHKVEFNTLTTVNSYNVDYPKEIYRFLKSIGSMFMQFLPVVERIDPNAGNNDLALVAPEADNAMVTEWSVSPLGYGKFLNTIFDEWVRNDVGRYYVQIFDATLANTVGVQPGLCTLGETCGHALAIEHNGDVYSCDHFVFPEYLMGNINDKPLIEIVTDQRQFDFGVAKRNSLPRQCLMCDVRHLCHGECPKHRIIGTDKGEKGLNYLCEGLMLYFKHTEPYMKYMAKELENKRPPANVMNWIKNRERQVVNPFIIPNRNDICPCGSGKKFKNCCVKNFH